MRLPEITAVKGAPKTCDFCPLAPSQPSPPYGVHGVQPLQCGADDSVGDVPPASFTDSDQRSCTLRPLTRTRRAKRATARAQGVACRDRSADVAGNESRLDFREHGRRLGPRACQ